MHKILLLALLSPFLALAGCGAGDGNGNGAHGTAETDANVRANVVTGTVSLQNGLAGNTVISPDAKLELVLEDISQRPSIPLSHKLIELRDGLPAKFELDYKPDMIYSEDVIVVIATITDGKRRFTMPLQQSVLTQGKPSHVDIELIPEPTEAEKMLAEFRHAEVNLGSLTMSNGTSLTDDTGRAWQIFKKNNHVQFVRDIEDNFNTNARVNTDYAYQDGAPWVVVRLFRPNARAAPVRTERAGWDKDGKLVLHEIEENGVVSELAPAAAQALHRDAQSMFQRVGGR